MEFAEVSKNLVRYSSENNFVGFYQNYVGHSQRVKMLQKILTS